MNFKRLLALVVVIGVMALIIAPRHTMAQYERNQYYMSSNCASFVPNKSLGPFPSAGAAVCWDTTLKAFFTSNGTAFVQWYPVPTATPT